MGEPLEFPLSPRWERTRIKGEGENRHIARVVSRAGARVVDRSVSASLVVVFWCAWTVPSNTDGVRTIFMGRP